MPTDPRMTNWRISIPTSIADAIERHPLIHDPVMEKPEYGKRSQLITQLLTNWLRDNTPIPTIEDLEKETKNKE